MLQVGHRIKQLLLLIYICSIKSQLLYADGSHSSRRSNFHNRRLSNDKSKSSSRRPFSPNPNSRSLVNNLIVSSQSSANSLRQSSSSSSSSRSKSNSNSNTNQSHPSSKRSLVSKASGALASNCPSPCKCKELSNYFAIYCNHAKIESLKDEALLEKVLQPDLYSRKNLAILDLADNNVTHVLLRDMGLFAAGFRKLREGGPGSSVKPTK